MSSAEGSFLSNSGVTSAIIVEDVGIGAGVETGSGQAGSGQTLFEGVGLIAMDLNRCLRCLSRNPALKFVAMSLSSSFSQILGGTTRSTPAFGSLMRAEEDEDGEEDEADGEDGGVGGRVLTL